jgi:hypothetical protein
MVNMNLSNFEAWQEMNAKDIEELTAENIAAVRNTGL